MFSFAAKRAVEVGPSSDVHDEEHSNVSFRQQCFVRGALPNNYFSQSHEEIMSVLKYIHQHVGHVLVL